ncbi:MAG TPA: hypothetical protein VHB21_09580, partial [Minicystis sp.]|nr:hypothetical protein [Minicystis sp.]
MTRKNTAERLDERARTAQRPNLAPAPSPVIDVGDQVAPPLPGKTHPPAEMSDAVPTLDDEHRAFHHHPNEAGAVTFGFDPENADAAADLAGELGAQFLEGATRVEDLSSRVTVAEDSFDAEVPMIIEEELGPQDENDDAPESGMSESVRYAIEGADGDDLDDGLDDEGLVVDGLTEDDEEDDDVVDGAAEHDDDLDDGDF